MKKLIITALFMVLGTNTAVANCPSGLCSVSVNATTGEVTYKDAQPNYVPSLLSSLPQPVEPTKTIKVESNNQTWATSGTPEQISQAVQVLAPKPLTADPCLNGGCNKVEINATTGVITVSQLTETDLKERARLQVEQSQKQAELAKDAYQALPNITEYKDFDPRTDEPIPATLQDESLTPDWWSDWFASLNWFFENWFWWWSL
jgi:hypothetical protein